MFEMCNAASKCLNMSAPSSLLHSINLSSPCNLGQPSGKSGRDTKVLMCCTRPTTSQLELRSRDLNDSLQTRSQLHLHGWCGWFGSRSPKFHNSNGTYRHVERLLSRVKQTCLLSRHNLVDMHPSRSSHGIIHLPSLSSWLQRAPLDFGRDITKSTEFTYERSSKTLDGTKNLDMHTSMATVMDMPPNSCIQPGGYVVHPATLDAATHTAAALVIIPTHGSNSSTPPYFVARHIPSTS